MFSLYPESDGCAYISKLRLAIAGFYCHLADLSGVG